MEKLFEPLQVGPGLLRNRFISSANYSAMSEEGGFFGERLARYHAEKARGGVALTITEELAVHPSTEFGLRMNVKAYDERSVPGFKLFTSMVHEHGAKTVGQLWHGGINVWNRDVLGARSRIALGPSPAPSLQNPDGVTVAKEMSLEEIREIQEYYVLTARNLVEGGFDGVEIHATHGYLPHQFLSPLCNKREDMYGGSPENRARFLYELVEMLDQEIKDKSILGVSLVGEEYFPGGLSLEDVRPVVEKLDSTRKVDYFSITPGGFGLNTHLNNPPMYYGFDLFRPLCASLKRSLGYAKLFAVGRIRDPFEAEEIISRNVADAVIMMRAQIADPELVNKSREGRFDDIIPCVGCNQACFGHVVVWSIPISCILNPTIGREKEWGIGTLAPSKNSKSILVIGGGPAGCEAAIIASRRGNRVTLCERSDAIGGQVRAVARLPGREEFGRAAVYWQNQLRKLGVKVKLNHEVTFEEALDPRYEAIIVATGSRAETSGRTPVHQSGIEGIANCGVATMTLDQFLSGERKHVGQNIVIYDDHGDARSAAAGELLSSQGCRVNIISRHGMLAQFADPTTRAAAQIRAFRKSVKFTPNTLINRVEDRIIYLKDLFTGRESDLRGVDSLILVTWRVAEDEIYRALHGAKKPVYCVGDCVSPRTIEEAVYEGHKVGREV